MEAITAPITSPYRVVWEPCASRPWRVAGDDGRVVRDRKKGHTRAFADADRAARFRDECISRAERGLPV